DVVVADQAGELVGEVGVVDAGADDLDGRGGPHGVHARVSPDLLALAVGLEDGDRDDSAAAEVGVQVRQVADLAHVGGLVEDRQHGRVQASAGAFGLGGGRAHDGVRARGDQCRGPASPVLAQQVQRVGGGDELRRAELGNVLLRGDPGGDLVVQQGGGVLAGSLVDAVARLRGSFDGALELGCDGGEVVV